MSITADFLDFGSGPRFTVLWQPEKREPLKSLLLCPPFGEELNKCRRTLALSARAFAEAGMAVLMVDLLGCGDSPGDFGDATWDQWCTDLRESAAWMQRRWHAPVVYWAVRAGSLFLPDLGPRESSACLLWQPVTAGDTYLNQILRLKIAADGFAGRAASTTKALKAKLEDDVPLEVAGYELNPDLVLPMAARSLSRWSPGSTPVVCLESGMDEPGEISPALARASQAWKDAGASVELGWVRGEAFWMTLEITENAALVERSLGSAALA